MEHGAAVVVTRIVKEGCDTDFANLQVRMEDAHRSAPGFLGCETFPPVPGQQDFWTSVVRFDSPESAQAWKESPIQHSLSIEAESLSADVDRSVVRTRADGWLSFGIPLPPGSTGSAPPEKWKQVLTALVGLFPTVVALEYFLGERLPWPTPLKVLLINALALTVVLFVMMPLLSVVLRGWLLPEKPIAVWKNAAGAAICVAAILVMLGVFLWLLPGK